MATVENKQGKVLTEIGTNEVEIMQFVLGSQTFGINVAKVKKLERYDPSLWAPIPGNPPDSPVRGYYYFRETPLPLIDLARAAKVSSPKTQDEKLCLISEFNALMNVFLIDDLIRIYRCSWRDLSPPPPTVAATTSIVTGSMRIDNKDVLLLDLEDIIAKLFPKAALQLQKVPAQTSTATGAGKNVGRTREQTRILVAEDSVTIRTLMTKILSEAGYSMLSVFNDGQDAFDEIVRRKREAEEKGGQLSQILDIVISDIEMPRMDGLTLCRRTREELREQTLPIIMFSSLIDQAMAEKCRTVKASNFITKPQIDELVRMLDGYREGINA